MFVLSFKNGDDDSSRNSFDECYIPLVEIKDFNALTDNKPFFDNKPLKNRQETYEKLIEISRNDDCQIGHLLHYLYHQKRYKLIGVDLSMLKNTSIPQQNNFVEKLKDGDGATMIFIAEKQQKIILNFF